MFDPDLNKDTIRLILIRAGLATKKYTEKWLSIRHKILGAPRHPDADKTSPGLYHFLLERFKTVVSIWEREGPSLCPPGHERKSLFNYNYLIEQLLLQHSVESYNLHSPWFPVKESDKVDALWTMWCGICAHADWPAYKPVWRADGRKVVDRKVASVPLQLQFRVRQRIKRPAVSKDKRPMKQTKLKE